MALPASYTFLEGLFDDSGITPDTVHDALLPFLKQDVVLAMQVLSHNSEALEASIRLEGLLVGNRLGGYYVHTLAGKSVCAPLDMLSGRQGRILVATKVALSELQESADSDRVETIA